MVFWKHTMSIEMLLTMLVAHMPARATFCGCDNLRSGRRHCILWKETRDKKARMQFERDLFVSPSFLCQGHEGIDVSMRASIFGSPYVNMLVLMNMCSTCPCVSAARGHDMPTNDYTMVSHYNSSACEHGQSARMREYIASFETLPILLCSK